MLYEHTVWVSTHTLWMSTYMLYEHTHWPHCMSECTHIHAVWAHTRCMSEHTHCMDIHCMNALYEWTHTQWAHTHWARTQWAHTHCMSTHTMNTVSTQWAHTPTAWTHMLYMCTYTECRVWACAARGESRWVEDRATGWWTSWWWLGVSVDGEVGVCQLPEQSLVTPRIEVFSAPAALTLAQGTVASRLWALLICLSSRIPGAALSGHRLRRRGEWVCVSWDGE